MKTGLTILLLAVILPSLAQAGDPCETCPPRGGESWVSARLVSIDTLPNHIGEIVVNVELYSWGGDTDCASIDWLIERACTDHDIGSMFFDGYICGVDCWGHRNDDNCLGGGYCDECGFWSHEYGNLDFHFNTWGKGVVKISHEGYLILQVPFDFGIYAVYGAPEFNYIYFRNRDYSAIADGDKFDALESVAIEVQATWPNEPAPAILVELSTPMSGPIRYEAMI